GVPVVARAGVVLAHDVAEAEEELGQPFGKYSAVLDECDGLALAAGSQQKAEAGLAELPDAGLPGAVQSAWICVAELFLLQRGFQRVEARAQLGFVLAVKLDEKNASRAPLDEPDIAGELQ